MQEALTKKMELKEEKIQTLQSRFEYISVTIVKTVHDVKKGIVTL